MMSFFERLFSRKPNPVEIQQNFIEKKSSRTATSRATDKLTKARVTCEDLPVLADVSELRKIETNTKFNSINSSVTKNSDSAKLNQLSIPSKLETTINAPVFDPLSDEFADSYEELNKESVLKPNGDLPNVFSIPASVLDLVPEALASRHQIIPVNLDGRVLTLLHVNELSTSTLNILSANLSAYKLIWQRTNSDTVESLIKHNYLRNDIFAAKTSSSAIEKFTQLKAQFNEKFISKNQLIFDSNTSISSEETNEVKSFLGDIFNNGECKNATDIDFDNSLEILPNGRTKCMMSVTIRVDGETEPVFNGETTRSMYDLFPRVLKSLCGINSVKDSECTSGVIKATLKKGSELIPVELRCQFMASQDRGTGVSVRIQKRHQFGFSLESIGLLPYQQKIFRERIINNLRGVTFFNGPMNKGKSCTLVTTLLELKKAKPTKNVGLIEDVPEFVLPKIRQIQIPHGLDFYDLEKHLLRYNLDIIAFGETRDPRATASIMNLSGTGHPGHCTIHADDACSVPQRLMDLKVEQYKIANGLSAAVSQVLVRRPCGFCEKVEDDRHNEVEQFEAYLDRLEVSRHTIFYKPTGKMLDGSTCSNCNGTGYKNRTGVFEILLVSEKLKRIISKTVDTTVIREQALREGFQTLWMNGLRKVLLGETTIDELLGAIKFPTPDSEGLRFAGTEVADIDMEYERMELRGFSY